MCVIGNTSDRTKVAVLSPYFAGAGDVIDEDDELHPALPLVRLIAVQHRRLNINTKKRRDVIVRRYAIITERHGTTVKFRYNDLVKTQRFCQCRTVSEGTRRLIK